jgi:hypothetical protein
MQPQGCEFTREAGAWKPLAVVPAPLRALRARRSPERETADGGLPSLPINTKKAPAIIRGRSQFLVGKQLRRYGFVVVVVVVVSSC